MHAGADARKPSSRMPVRPAKPDDADACNALSRRVHGFDRGVELAQAIEQGTARVVERGGRITGYTTHLAFFGHSTAETNVDLQSLIASAESFLGAGNTCTFKKPRFVPLVLDQRAARGSAVDINERRNL